MPTATPIWRGARIVDVSRAPHGGAALLLSLPPSLFVAPVPLRDRWYSGSVVACQILPGRIRQEGERGRQVEGGRERKAPLWRQARH